MTTTDMPTTDMPIGRMAERLGLSPRTLRYYEEFGLLRSVSKSAGGTRRYDEADYQRVLRIRELQAVMGFNLDEIREILHSDDRLDELGAEYRKGADEHRRRDILVEVARLNARTEEQVLAKIAILEAFQAELVTKAERYIDVAAELGIDLAPLIHAEPTTTASP